MIAVAPRFARIDPALFLVVPGAGYLLFVYGLPLASLLLRSVWTPAGPSLASFEAFFADAFTWRVIGNTLRVALLIVLVSLVVACPVAFALARAASSRSSCWSRSSCRCRSAWW